MTITGPLTDLEAVIRSSWGEDTCDPVDLPWEPDNPAKGQCGVTTLVLHDLLGGQLAVAEVELDGQHQGYHYWLRTSEGADIDLTSEQFLSGERFGVTEILERPGGLPTRCADEYVRLRNRVFERLGLPVS
jgi:hypothetical protein